MVTNEITEVVISGKDARALALKHYFTGKPCKRGHISKRFVSGAKCVACGNEQLAKWRAENPEKARQKYREFEYKHREKRLAKNRRYHRENKEKRNADSRQWYLENTEKALAASAEYMKTYRALPGAKEANARRCSDYKNRNPDKIRAITRAWNEKNRGKKQAYERIRKARKLGNGGSHTAEDIIDIFRMQGGKCAICRTSLKTIAQHVDHIIPLVDGGSSDRRNLQILCGPCNLRKGRRDPIDMMRSLGRLL